MSTIVKRAALLGVLTLLAVMMWAGPAGAVENGRIYYYGGGAGVGYVGIYSIDPTASNPQRTLIGLHTTFGATFDISRDQTTLVGIFTPDDCEDV